MTRPMKPSDMQRVRRRIGDVLREPEVLRCPVNHPIGAGPLEFPQKHLRVVAYRENTVRLECQICGLRFSLNPIDVFRTLDTRDRKAREFGLLDWCASMAGLVFNRQDH